MGSRVSTWSRLALALLRHYATSSAMGMEITEEQKESAKQGEKGYSIVQVICSAILLGIGIQYL